jgi:hypothetical protein
MLNIDLERILGKSISTLLLFGVVCHTDATPETIPLPVTVEAIGQSIADTDKSVDMQHKEAVLDALNNAVLQANPTINSRRTLKDITVQTHDIYIHTLGFAELNQILNFGLKTNSTPDTYVVRIKATVWEQPSPFLRSIIAETSPPSQITVTLYSSLEAESKKALNASITEALNSRGIPANSVDPESEEFTLKTTVLEQDDPPALELRWDARRTFLYTPQGKGIVGRVMGSHIITSPEELAMNRPVVASRLAEDVQRLVPVQEN